MFSTDKKSSAFYRNEDAKSSYYVWFLGSKESKGLRGAEYIRPVVRQLLDRKSDNIKLTLQVSSKGLKIVQTPEKKKRNGDAIKQFIPYTSITCAVQSDAPHDDIVSCILLVSNADCPLYVHSYRCDSAETAELLVGQLKELVDRPENQRKFEEIEQRLADRGLLKASSRSSSKLGSDGRSLGRSSSSSGAGSELTPPSDKLVTLYDSLAAELREKLGQSKLGKAPPLLLPPRDYDTMHRHHGDVLNAEKRRALHPAVVGKTGRGSDGSSGIGSESPSPGVLEEEKFHESDDDWPVEDTPTDRPLVPIAPYRPQNAQQQPLSARFNEGGHKLGRKNSFQEIQQKFRSLERPSKSNGNVASKVEKDVFANVNVKKLEQVLQKDMNNRSRFDNSRFEGNNRLESYLQGANQVKRQASKCSSVQKDEWPSRSGRSPAAVQKDEWPSRSGRSPGGVAMKKEEWPWERKGVPLTKELSPEFRRELSPPQRAARGQSSPAGHRRQSRSPKRNGPWSRGLSPGFRRALSPDHRVRAMSPDLRAEPVRVLRREKTSVFDNRYPSLDLRSDKRKSVYEELALDPRRRSYHETAGGGDHISRNLGHSGKKSKDYKELPHHQRFPGLDKATARLHHHHHVTTPWSDPRRTPTPNGGRPAFIHPQGPPRVMPLARAGPPGMFGGGIMRHY